MTLHANNAAFAHRATIRRTAQRLDDEIHRGNFSNDALIGDLLFLILGPETHRRVEPDPPKCRGCGPDGATGEDIDIDPDCPRHGANGQCCDRSCAHAGDEVPF